MKVPQPVSFARLIVAKLEYVGPTDKSTFTISQAKLYSFTLIINWESKEKQARLTIGLHIDVFKLYLRSRKN